MFFANLRPPSMQTTHVEAVQAPEKVKPLHGSSLPEKPVEDTKPVPVPPQPAPVETLQLADPPPQSTTHEALMQAAGISQADWPAVEKMIMMESSWDAGAVEPTTGACGLAQELPCGKSGCGGGDAVCELRWASQYVVSRYGGWTAALNFHYRNGWY